MKKALNLVRENLIRVEDKIRKNLDSQVPLIHKISDHLLASGGKRIRPMLLILCAGLSGYRGESLSDLATAVEYIHSASLLHDDVVDGAVLRRGNASANSVWGNEASVLVGDYLFAQSFSILVQFGNRKIMDILARATVVMAEGEVLQLASVRNPVSDLSLYMDIVRSKTAALISAACQCGGVMGDATPEQELALKNFGLDLGMAFQFTDDVLDYVGEVDEFGKSRGNDFNEGKLTLPLIYALSCASESERAIVEDLFSRDNVLEEDFKATVSFVEKWGGFKSAHREAEKMVVSAKKNLGLFPACEEKQALLELADYVISRRR